MVKHITLEAIEKVFMEMRPRSLGIADMGCSSGPNTLSNVKEFVDAVEETCRKVQEPEPEFRVYLNDLPTNDFNTIFQALPDFYRELRNQGCRSSVYIAGFPGTFYGRIFPESCLHLVYSSYSLHWLSRVTIYPFSFSFCQLNMQLEICGMILLASCIMHDSFSGSSRNL